MAIGPQSGIGGINNGGYKFDLGPETNQFGSDTSTAEQAATARDNYGSSNPDWLAAYDANQNLFIELTFLNSMQDATQEIAFVAQRRKNGLWQTVSHNDNTNSPIPPTAGKVGNGLTAIDDTGGMAWTNPPIFSVTDAATLDNDSEKPLDAINISSPSKYVYEVNNSGYEILNLDAVTIEADINARLALDATNTFYDSGSKLVSNVSDAVSDNDAVNKKLLDDLSSISFKTDATDTFYDAQLKSIENVSSLSLDSSSDTPVIESDGGLTFKIDGGTMNFYNDSSLMAYLDSTYFNFYDVILQGVKSEPSAANAVTVNSQLAPLATSEEVDQGFENAVNPSDAKEGFMHNENQPSDGYVTNHRITYFNPVPGDFENKTASVPPADAGYYGFIHYATKDRLGMMLWHEDGINQMFGVDVSGDQSIAIQLDEVRSVLGQYNKTADTSKYIWNLEGRGVAPGSNVNEITGHSEYVDKDGNSVSSRSDAVNGAYSSGTIVQNGSIVAVRGGYCFDAEKLISVFVPDPESKYFVLRDVIVGGGTFNDVKVFSVFQYSFEQISGAKISYYDSSSNILGAQLNAMIEATDALDVRVHDLENPEESDLDESVSHFESGAVLSRDTVAIAQDADVNGLVESIIMHKSISTKFDLLQSQTVTKKLGYNSTITNSIIGRVIVVDLADASKHHTINYRIDDGVLNIGDEEFTHDFDIIVSKTVVNEQVNLTLSGSNSDVSILVKAEVIS